MPAIGNASNFRAINVAPSKPPARAAASLATRMAPAQTVAPAPRTVVSDVRPHGSGVLTTTSTKSATSSAAQTNRQPVDRLAALTQQQRLSRLISAMTRGAMADPLSPIATNGPVMTAPLQQMEFQGQFNQDFQNLQKMGLLPKGTTQPPLSFVSGGLNGPMDERSYEKGSGAGARIFIPPGEIAAATGSNGAAYGWGREVPIHELAHAMQTRHVKGSVPVREGGAQAYADAAAIRAVGPISENDTNYSKYVQQVRRLGPRFYMKRQFGG